MSPHEVEMKVISFALLFALIIPSAFGQKVKVGFDKSADFSKYHTFSWSKAEHAPEMTLRRMLIMGEIEHALNSKGLLRVEEGGDVTVSGFGEFAGQMGGGSADPIVPAYSTISSTSSSMWTGQPAAAASAVLSSSLILQMVDRSADKLVWQGTVTQKIDMDNKSKTIERLKGAIVKLVDRYPPRK
jgi:hypothetical protein